MITFCIAFDESYLSTSKTIHTAVGMVEVQKPYQLAAVGTTGRKRKNLKRRGGGGVRWEVRCLFAVNRYLKL
jgi:hypothetical protein